MFISLVGAYGYTPLQILRFVKVYRASDPKRPTISHRDEIAEAEPAVPGWSMPVEDLFM